MQQSPQNMADSRSPEAQRVWQKLQNEDHYVENLVNAIHGSKSNVTGSSAKAKLDKFDSENASSVNESLSRRIKHQAISKGFSEDGIRNNISEQKESVQDKHGEMVDKNNVQYNSAKKDNERQEATVQKRADTYEKNREFFHSGGSLGIGKNTRNDERVEQQKASNNLIKE